MSDLCANLQNLNVNEDVSANQNNFSGPLAECETAEDALTTSSEEYLAEPLRYRNFQYPNASSTVSNTMSLDAHQVTSSSFEENGNFSCFNNIQIPIVGYEIMEERARFTVYKLRIENKDTGDCWYVFRRYTDFVRLCNKLKPVYPQIIELLPRKRWLKNNFDPLFLEERVNGLQTLVNAILAEPELILSQDIQDFFCLNEPPICSETNEESRAMLEALEETVSDLKIQLREKEALIDTLQESLHSKTLENDNLQQIIKNTTANCDKCHRVYDNIVRVIK